MIVEGEGFKHLCRHLQQFTITSRHTVAKGCFQLHIDAKVKLKSLLELTVIWLHSPLNV